MKHILLLAMVIVAVVGAGVFVGHRHTQLTVPDLEIVRTSGGGLSGKGDGHNFTLSAKDLTPSQLKDVTSKVTQAGFFAFATNYPAVHCADSFITALQIRLKGITKKVTFADCGQKDLPAPLVTLDSYLQQLTP